MSIGNQAILQVMSGGPLWSLVISCLIVSAPLAITTVSMSVVAYFFALFA